MRRLVTALATSTGLVAALVLTASPALGSASGSDGPGGTVNVGASSGGQSGGNPGAPAGLGGSGGGGSGNGGSGSSAWSCTYMPLILNDQALPPGGPTPGGWYSMTCNNSVTGASFNQTLWLSSQASTAPVPAVDPRVLAEQAERSLQLPSPSMHFNPVGPSVVNLPTILWIDRSIWHSYSVTASAGSVSATAVATPLSVTWTMGDGAVVTCPGPGIPFDGTTAPSEQGSSCQHVYRSTSAGQPTPDGNPNDDAFTVVARVSWSVEWSAQGAPGGGPLAPLSTSASTTVRVEQVQSLFRAEPDSFGTSPSSGTARAILGSEPGRTSIGETAS